MKGIPLLITIPHGGRKIPSEVKDQLAVNSRQIFEDMDPFIRDIFNLEGIPVIAADMARCVIDLNRARGDVPPKSQDGIIKSHTCHGVQIYKDGCFPNTDMLNRLVKRYYEPFHRKIVKTLTSGHFQLALDCHSMAAIGPEIAPDTGEERPMICLSNADGQSCSPEWMEIMADSFRQAFDLEKDQVTINHPFKGGYITRTYGNRPCPWVQVELNRDLYLTDPWFNEADMTVDPSRLTQLRNAFDKALMSFCTEAGVNTYQKPEYQDAYL